MSGMLMAAHESEIFRAPLFFSETTPTNLHDAKNSSSFCRLNLNNFCNKKYTRSRLDHEYSGQNGGNHYHLWYLDPITPA